jgi:nitrilase
LRFPDLFQALAEKGAHVIALPAAFTLHTGKDHWEVLLRARAIETQTYVCAAGQTGIHMHGDEQRATYGHSMAIDPWGHVIARASDGAGYVAARIDRARIEKVRAMIPVAQHKVLFT